MKRIILAAMLLSGAYAHATCLNGVESDGSTCTTLTIGAQTANCAKFATQDGVTINAGAWCVSGFYGGSGLQIELPNDPVNPGQPLDIYGCTLTTASDSIVPSPAALGSTRTLTQSISCPGVNENYYTADWSGQVVSKYTYAMQRRCTSGRGQTCKNYLTAFLQSETVELTTPKPPPMPPPPPQPTILALTLTIGACNSNFVCTLNPLDKSVILRAKVDPYNYLITLTNLDGTLTTLNLDYSYVSELNDDGSEYSIQGGVQTYDANGNPSTSYDFAFVTRTGDRNVISVASGELDITTQPALVAAARLLKVNTVTKIQAKSVLKVRHHVQLDD